MNLGAKSHAAGDFGVLSRAKVFDDAKNPTKADIYPRFLAKKGITVSAACNHNVNTARVKVAKLQR